MLVKPHWCNLSAVFFCLFLCPQVQKQGKHFTNLFFIVIIYFKSLFAALRSVRLGCEEATTGKKCISIPFNTRLPQLRKNRDFLIRAVFCFSFLLIHHISKATGSNIVFYFIIFIAGRSRKAQVHRQTWVSIKRDFLISEIMYSMFRI